MKKIALFNNKGGVGKTTLTVNLADALSDLGKTILLVDADPQCNLTSFYIPEDQLEKLLGDSDDEDSANTIWSAIKPVVVGRGGIKQIPHWRVGKSRIFLLPGDVLLSDYEEALPAAWTDSFARKTRGYDVMSALSQLVNVVAKEVKADIVMYDVGPNVGALNRAILLDCDYFVTPVAADLFSLRALTTVGRSVAKWSTDWAIIRGMAANDDIEQLPVGLPHYLGYVTSAYKVGRGAKASDAHTGWEKDIGPRVRYRVIDTLRKANVALATPGASKLGGIRHYHSLAPEAQKHGVAIGKLRGLINSGQNEHVDEAKEEFSALAQELVKRMGI
ncbi:ParA family protein [Burkholderia stagnalis]|uniref:ParA family protein n=1 Tax=Burkholderia stagnalis TaxID=1503054 RepID=UPI0009C05B45|nr:AAA family ATPase [Burkholderia stagnalis]